ncbi:4Fe-4S binding protein [Eubacteriaceae bacterium ES2]|nr:4Fe-4S binding protein [Eubacteriaceae bacterium ES2]
MKAQWQIKRRKDDLIIPEDYLEKNDTMQNRRELTFLLQEAAFAEQIRLFHIVDLTQRGANQIESFLKEMTEAKSLIFLGTPILEPLLLMEQTVFGLNGEKQTTMIASKVESDLRSFAYKLEIIGYETIIKVPSVLPNEEISEVLALTKAGFIGRNKRFIIDEFGCRICLGYLISNAPLMGGDYRYPVYNENRCRSCMICIDQCPAGALSPSGYNKNACLDFRDDIKNQKRIAEYSFLKCNRCMESCPLGKKWETE